MTSIRRRNWTSPKGEEKTAWLVDYVDNGGKRRAKQFAKKKDAEAWLVGAAWQVSQGTHTADSASVTVKKAAELWIEKAEAEDRERSTIKQYKELERLHISPFIGNVKLSRLTMPMVEKYRDDLVASRSRAMAGKAVRALSMVLAEAQRRGLVAQNVAKGVKVVRQGREKSKIEIPTRQELKALLATATDDEKPLVMTAILTGLRSSELRGLRWQDVDLKKGTVSVNQRADQWGAIGPPKSAAGFRTIPISPALVTVLKAWKLRATPSTLDLVFPNAKGGAQWHQNMLRRMFIPLQARAGVSEPKLKNGKPLKDDDGAVILTGRYGFHALRHAAASGWIAQRIPISHERVRASVLYPLDPAFGAVVDKEVDGDDSLAARMEARNPTRRISQSRAATRAARAVFICSAPLVGQPNAGLNGLGLRLACAEPGDQIAIFGEALRELSERATYLYEEAGRYWFSSSPTLNRLADERARALADHEVDADICAFLRQDAGSRGGFHKVFAAPDDPSTIDEAIALSLVILAPASPHSGRGVAKSVGTDAIGDALTRCRASLRRFRNTLMFVAPDEALLANARDVVRKAMAWESVVKDDRLQAQLTQAQSGDTKDKARKNRDAAGKAIRAAWNHILYPIQSDKPGTPFDLEHISVAPRENVSIPASVYEKIKADGVAKEKLGTETLWLSLKPIWASERPYLLISEIAEWFASYVYLPKIKDKIVLELAIRDSVGKLDAAFGYADRYNESAQSYANLLWAKTPPEFMPNTAIIVREDVVRNELEKIAPVAERDGGGPQPEPLNSGAGPSGEQAVGGIVAPQSVKRFYGSVEIDMVRPIKALETIIEAVVMQLQHSSGAKVKLTLDVEATTDSGFSDADISVVRDNARQLKFNPESTGFE